jgi:hypothetical protein
MLLSATTTMITKIRIRTYAPSQAGQIVGEKVRYSHVSHLRGSSIFMYIILALGSDIDPGLLHLHAFAEDADASSHLPAL